MLDNTDVTNANGNTEAGNQQAAGNANQAATILYPNNEGTSDPGSDNQEDQAKPVVPEKYDIKLPETSFFDEAALERTTAIARELGLPQEGAQKMTDFAHGEVAKYHESLVSSHKTQVNEWAKNVKADPEIGGAAFQQNADLANRVLDKFSNPEFRKVLNDTGYGNHPELVRVFARIGKVLGDDTLVMGNHGGSNAGKSLAEKLYPTQQK